MAARLLLVRHGQASFLSKNYDQLSPLGELQARLLGEAWRITGPKFPVSVISGTLKRQQRTLEKLAEAWRPAAPLVEVDAGLDEFPFERLVEHWLPEMCMRDLELKQAADAVSNAGHRDERYKAVQDLLVAMMSRWQTIAANEHVAGVPRWPDFVARASETVLTRSRSLQDGQSLVAVTSGGVIASFLATVMGGSPEQAISLSWPIKNASVAEFSIDQGGVTLRRFNDTQHIPAALQTHR